jgi:hypothetical protein
LNKLQEEASGQKEYILQLESNLSDAKDQSSKVEEEFQKEKLELEESLKEKLVHMSDLEARVSTVQEEHAKLELSLKEKDSQLQELAVKSGDGTSPPTAVAENAEEVSKLQEKQKETMHKLKAAVAKGKSIQKKLGLKETELSELQEEHSKLLKQLQQGQESEREKKSLGFPLQGGNPVQSGFEPQPVDVDVLPASDPTAVPMQASESASIHFDEANSSSFHNNKNNSHGEDGWGSGGPKDDAIHRAPHQDAQQYRGVADHPITRPDSYDQGGDSDNDGEDIKLDEALKSAGTSLWNWVSGE